MFKLLSFFISHVLRGNTVFAKTFFVIRVLENIFTWLICCHSGLKWVSNVAFPICQFPTESSQLGTDERNGVFLFLSSVSYQLEEVQILP